jgi:glucosamine--fructose-6-phosphate aminotransferase (isomerizing)
MSSVPLQPPGRPGVSVQTMLRLVESQAMLIPRVVEAVTPQIRVIADQLVAQRIANVFTTGCGDSYYAALATRLAFEMYSGVRVEPIEALELSRYSVDYLPPNSAVVGVSAGGETSRPLEALRQAQRVGAATIALTGHRESPLARAADQAIIHNEAELRVEAPAGEGTFALGNYLAATLSLYVLAFELGCRSGALTETRHSELLAEIGRAPSIIEATLASVAERVRVYAASVVDRPAYYLVGGGPSLATVLFIGAKLFEMPQALGVPVELEEWAHEQFFPTRPGSATLVVAPPGRSIDRAREQMIGARDMGAHVVAICDSHDGETMALADVVFPIEGPLAEEFSPLTYLIPGELLAIGLCHAGGRPAFSFMSPWQHEVNMRQIKHSQQRLT